MTVLSSSSSSSDANTNTKNRLVYGSQDALFGYIEQQQQQDDSVSFGRMLDAGTGLHSLRWIASLRVRGLLEHCTAVTADIKMQRNCQREVEALLPHDNDCMNVITGNWFSSSPLDLSHEEPYDVILLDYLIGAMDGFSPYQQDQMIPKLTKYLKPQGRLYIVGLQPLPDSVPEVGGNIICRVRQVRDACILLAGHRCYREYPVEWIQRQVARQYGLALTGSTAEFPIQYKLETVVKQINVGRSKFPFFDNPELVSTMKQVLDDLEAQMAKAIENAPTGRVRLGFDYVVCAEKVDETEDEA